MTALDDLRRRVEALEGRAATEESSAPEPAPAPAADRPLWKVMQKAYGWAGGHQEGFAAEIDAVADWLAAREHCGAAESADLLRAEACRAREGA